MTSLPEEPMVSERLRIRNEKLLLYEYSNNALCFFGNAIWGLCRCNFAYVFEMPHQLSCDFAKDNKVTSGKTTMSVQTMFYDLAFVAVTSKTFQKLFTLCYTIQ